MHKVQGFSLPQIFFSFDLQKHKCFKPGPVYVALSRVTSIQVLFYRCLSQRGH